MNTVSLSLTLPSLYWKVPINSCHQVLTFTWQVCFDSACKTEQSVFFCLRKEDFLHFKSLPPLTAIRSPRWKLQWRQPTCGQCMNELPCLYSAFVIFGLLHCMAFTFADEKKKKNIKKQYKSKLTNLLGFFFRFICTSLLHWRVNLRCAKKPFLFTP